MFDKIIEIISKVKLDYWFYIGLGVVALAFLIPLIASFIGGELNLFKKTAAKVIKANDPKTVNGFMTTMPIKVKKLYKRAVMTKAKPSDIINVDSCVNAPYGVSLYKKLGTITLIATILTMLFIGSMSAVLLTVIDPKLFAIIGVIALEGALFTVISFAAGSSAYSGSMKVYNKLMDILDNFSKGGQMSNEESVEESPIEAVTIETTGSVDAEMPQNKAYDFDGPSRITVEIEDEEPKQVNNNNIIYEQPEPVFAEVEAVIMAKPMEDEATIKARAREEALKAARAEAQARAAQAEARQRAEAQARAATPPPERPQPAANTPPMRPQPSTPPVRPQAAQVGASNADDVIARIEKINQEGAPLATMKEVALLLQQERAKPENKTPEQQRKLNEALSKLLKAMSGANKK